MPFCWAVFSLLTLAAYLRSAWVSMQNREFGNKFSRDLSLALTEAELALAPRRGAQQLGSILQLEQNAKELLNEIAAERERLAELAGRRERELGDLGGITENLNNSSVVS